ncbi:agmatine deiminase [Marinomonas pollencensis]|uniref:Putative agmatine deiminase n=1 Tax=Marinomonas pollencensis TaxID=491954 RepID=A0A3E0DSZ5_9GAMM|nr:agmatine deiminase [Marinomonas pollencensis]REG86679.1 agmatine deiminase [Marinomonas pollencensis]
MSALLDTTPKQDGFRMPGEHEPQDQVWLAWPIREDNWRESGKPAQQAFARVANTIAQSTAVTVVVLASHYDIARAALNEGIRVLVQPYNDSWMRDIGATYVVNDKGQRRAISWQFNAWGGKLDGLYSPWDLDDAMAVKMASVTGDDYYQAPFILEGGSIHSDGEGTLYTTEECLLHPSRNPDLSKADIEAYLADYLNIQKVIWLTNGLFNDETNGHIDNIMHLVRPGVVALTWCDDQNDPQYAISRAAYQVLQSSTDAQGRAIEIIKLPLPGPLYMTATESQGIQQTDTMERHDGDRLAASYANFLISNQSVIFPLLDTKTDKQAEQILAAAFPLHQVIGVPAREILLGGGNIHCITQQVPKQD